MQSIGYKRIEISRSTYQHFCTSKITEFDLVCKGINLSANDNGVRKLVMTTSQQIPTASKVKRIYQNILRFQISMANSRNSVYICQPPKYLEQCQNSHWEKYQAIS